MSQGKERRRSPRIKADHELIIRHSEEGGSDEVIIGRSVDLNLNGIYCGLSRHLPLFTKLAIHLRLPVALREGAEPEVFELPLEGVIVRIDPEMPEAGRDHYFCALAFVNTDPDAELVLARYLLQSLARMDSAATE